MFFCDFTVLLLVYGLCITSRSFFFFLFFIEILSVILKGSYCIFFDFGRIRRINSFVFSELIAFCDIR